MAVLLGGLVIIGLIIWAAAKDGGSAGQNTSRSTFRCPTCGAEARVSGDRWECGWCGDFGSFTRK